MDFVPRATVIKGSPLWMEKQTSCLEECLHLVVLFDSTAHLCFHKRDYYFSQSLQPVCLYTFSMCYTPHKQLTELASSPDGN